MGGSGGWGGVGGALPVPVSRKVPAVVTAGSWLGSLGGGKLREERAALAERASGEVRELPHLLSEEDGDTLCQPQDSAVAASLTGSCSQGIRIPAHIPPSCVPNTSPQPVSHSHTQARDLTSAF